MTFVTSRFVKSPYIQGGAIEKLAAAGLTLSFIDSATSTGSTVTGPAGIQSDDLLVLCDYGRGFSTPSTAVPSGFTAAVNSTAPSSRGIISYKIADGSEASATLTGLSGPLDNGKALMVFRGSSSISSITVQDVTGEGTTGNPASQTQDASGFSAPLIVFANYGADSSIDPRTFSPTEDGEVSGTGIQYAKYKIYNSSPADVTIDMDDEGSNNILQSVTLEAA